MAVFFFLPKFRQNFDLKNMISNYAKGFPWKKWPKLVRFQNRYMNSRSPNFYDKFQKVVKNTEGFCFFSTFISNL
jgi:hypothetical protein